MVAVVVIEPVIAVAEAAPGAPLGRALRRELRWNLHRDRVNYYRLLGREAILLRLPLFRLLLPFSVMLAVVAFSSSYLLGLGRLGSRSSVLVEFSSSFLVR